MGVGFPASPHLVFKQAKRSYFEFSSTCVGVGMICPFMVNLSLLFGAIISWVIMWPLIELKKGDWYSASLSSSSLHDSRLQGFHCHCYDTW